MASEMGDLPGQGYWETGSHHTVAGEKAGGMIDLWLGLEENS